MSAAFTSDIKHGHSYSAFYVQYNSIPDLY